MSTCMYYTGVDPRTMKPVYVARDPHEKAMQRALIQYRKPENYKLVHEALIAAGRRDLIGYDKHCLIRPVPPHEGAAPKKSSGKAKGTGGTNRPHADSRHKQAGATSKQHRGPGGAQQMNRAQNAAARNRAAQGRQGANRQGRRG